MANVQFTSMEAYRRHVLSGAATTQKDRIMRFLFMSGRPVTRNEIDRFFNPPMGRMAKDAKPIIRWRSSSAAVSHLLDDDYIRVDHEGVCPVTGTGPVQFLAPNEEKWNQRRLF